MHIFLYGPSGTGKSTVGAQLADSLNLKFLDLDVEIERAAGQNILDIMTKQGEASFRNLETAALRSVLSDPEKVVALGGGALLRDENRSLVEHAGQVILLEADLSTLVGRLSRDETQRPLLMGELETKLGALLERRGEHYASFPLGVDATRPPEEVVWDIQRLLGRYHLRAMGTGYDVVVKEGGIDGLGKMMKSRKLGGPVLVVSDINVAQHYIERVLKSLRDADFAASELIIPAGEAYKNLRTVESLWRGCLEAGLDRKSTIVALGGGMVGDLAGFFSLRLSYKDRLVYSVDDDSRTIFVHRARTHDGD